MLKWLFFFFLVLWNSFSYTGVILEPGVSTICEQFMYMFCLSKRTLLLFQCLKKEKIYSCHVFFHVFFISMLLFFNTLFFPFTHTFLQEAARLSFFLIFIMLLRYNGFLDFRRHKDGQKNTGRFLWLIGETSGRFVLRVTREESRQRSPGYEAASPSKFISKLAV